MTTTEFWLQLLSGFAWAVALVAIVPLGIRWMRRDRRGPQA